MRTFQAGKLLASQPCTACLGCAPAKPETPTRRNLLVHTLPLYSPVHNPALDTTGHVGVQSAAEFRHVQRHRHVRNVSGSPHVPCARYLGLFLPCILSSKYLCRHHPTPPFRPLCPRFDSSGSVGIQPAAESRHVQRHKHAWHASGAPRVPCARCPLVTTMY